MKPVQMINPFGDIITPAFTGLIERIVTTCKPQKIFLLSVAEHKQQIRSVFTEGPFENHLTTSYQLLLLVTETEKKNIHELQDKIENLSGDTPSVTAIIITADQFIDWLNAGHPFAAAVFEKAFLCYDGDHSPLSSPGYGDKEKLRNDLKLDLQKHTHLATEFFAGAELFTIRKNYPLAAFNLHQAAEQSLAGLIRCIMGWRVQTHSLDKLYRHAQYLVPGLTELFPRNTVSEKKIFQLFQRAYSETRYTKTYIITYPELDLLLIRVKKLIRICSKLFSCMPG